MDHKVPAFSERLTLKNRKDWVIRSKAEITRAKCGGALTKARNETNADMHDLARSILVPLLHSCDLPLYEKHTDVRELYAALEARYVGEATLRIPALYAEIAQLHMEPREGIRAYVKKLRDTVGELTQCNQAVSDAYVVSVGLNGLRSEFKDYTKNFYSNPSDMPKDLDDLEGRLMMIELKISSDKPQASTSQATLYAGGNYSNAGGSYGRRQVNNNGNKPEFYGRCYKCNEMGHRAASCPNKQQQTKNICAYCKKPGHTEGVCRKKKRDEGRDDGPENPQFLTIPVVGESRMESKPQVAAAVAAAKLPQENKPQVEAAVAAAAKPPEKPEKPVLPAMAAPQATKKSAEVPQPAGVRQTSPNIATWFVDSGAFYHVTPDASTLHNFQVLKEPISLTAAGGEVYAAVGFGDVKIEFETRGT